MSTIGEFFTGEGILSSDQLDRIRSHRYKSSGVSVVDANLYPIWQWLQSQYPVWLAPNCITVSGLAVNILGLALLSCYSPDAKKEAPRWAYFFCVACLLAYNALDSTDGLHARKTGTVSSLGELLDHGCDSLSQVSICMILCICLQLGERPLCVLALYLLGSTIFYCAHWQTFVTGVMQFNRFDATEGEISIQIFLIVSGCWGANAWSKEFLHVPLKYYAAAFSISVVIINLCAYMRSIVIGSAGKGRETIVGPLVSLLTILLPPILMYRASPTNVLQEQIIACMSGIGVNVWDSILWGPVAVLLNYYFHMPISERLSRYLLLAYCFIDLYCYCWIVVGQLCRHLHIDCFRVPVAQ